MLGRNLISTKNILEYQTRVDDAHLKSASLFGRSCHPLLPIHQVCFTPNILECIRNFLEEKGTSAGFPAPDRLMCSKSAADVLFLF